MWGAAFSSVIAAFRRRHDSEIEDQIDDKTEGHVPKRPSPVSLVLIACGRFSDIKIRRSRTICVADT